MRFRSVCSGIEAASVAWTPLGWECVELAEIEPFPCSVLNYRYPEIPNHGDFTTIRTRPKRQIQPADILVGGTPCQSFSVSGLRKGMGDARGQLALEFLRLADATRPRWICWENVPGVLSSGRGRDFGSFLGGLGELGYGWAYRVLDAQYTGVPQRRRRVFVVGCAGSQSRAAAVLFERHSLSGDTPPCREAGQDVAGTIAARTGAGGGLGTDFDLSGGLQVSCTLPSSNGGGQGSTRWVQARSTVRRLTPLECERLQGFPDGWTNIPHRGKPAADSVRYKAIGNSIPTTFLTWLGQRIELVEGI